MAEGLITVIIGIVYVIYKINREKPGYFSGLGRSFVFIGLVIGVPCVATYFITSSNSYTMFNNIMAVILLIYGVALTAVLLMWVFGYIDISEWFLDRDEKAVRARARFDQQLCDRLMCLPVPSGDYLHAHDASKGWRYTTEDLARHWRVDQLDRIRGIIIAMPVPDEKSMKSYRESLGKQWRHKTDDQLIWQWRSEQIWWVTKQVYTEHANNGIIQINKDQW